MTQPPVAQPCYRHPDRPTFIRCQRCGRPICGDCMISAAVGFHCPECVADGARQTRQNVGPYGGRRSANPSLTSILLIALNVIVWGAITLTGGYASQLADAMALWAVGRPSVASGAVWQLLTSGFTHIDVLHLGMNMLALWFLGPSLEAALGRARFLTVYLLSVLSGSVLVLWLSPLDAATLGASGGVFGLIGALLVLAYKVRGDVRTVLLWLGINLVYTFVGSGNISWQGHLGGLLGGLAAAAIIGYAPKANRQRVQVFGLAGLAALLLALVAVRVLQLA